MDVSYLDWQEWGPWGQSRDKGGWKDCLRTSWEELWISCQRVGLCVVGRAEDERKMKSGNSYSFHTIYGLLTQTRVNIWHSTSDCQTAFRTVLLAHQETNVLTFMALKIISVIYLVPHSQVPGTLDTLSIISIPHNSLIRLLFLPTIYTQRDWTHGGLWSPKGKGSKQQSLDSNASF